MIGKDDKAKVIGTINSDALGADDFIIKMIRLNFCIYTDKFPPR